MSKVVLIIYKKSQNLMKQGFMLTVVKIDRFLSQIKAEAFSILC